MLGTATTPSPCYIVSMSITLPTHPLVVHFYVISDLKVSIITPAIPTSRSISSLGWGASGFSPVSAI